jgi:hypothetical protein|tara:strand:+ start:111 stop:332 length:222 start_codon:yes stop_codon:yes gene_type:complete
MNVTWDFLEIALMAGLAIVGAFVKSLTARISRQEFDLVDLKTKIAVGQQLHNEILNRLSKIETLLEEMRKSKP